MTTTAGRTRCAAERNARDNPSALCNSSGGCPVSGGLTGTSGAGVWAWIAWLLPKCHARTTAAAATPPQISTLGQRFVVYVSASRMNHLLG